MLIQLSKGKFALVDRCDVKAVSQLSWYAFNPKPNNPKIWYAANKTSTNYITLHRFIATRMGLPLSNKIDHIDQNGLNCKRNNLRAANSTQNQANTRGHKDSISGLKGVSKAGKRWRARIFANKKEILIGHFDTAQQAADAYDLKAKEIFGEFALTNNEIKHAKKEE